MIKLDCTLYQAEIFYDPQSGLWHQPVQTIRLTASHVPDVRGLFDRKAFIRDHENISVCFEAYARDYVSSQSDNLITPINEPRLVARWKVLNKQEPAFFDLSVLSFTAAHQIELVRQSRQHNLMLMQAKKKITECIMAFVHPGRIMTEECPVTLDASVNTLLHECGVRTTSLPCRIVDVREKLALAALAV